MKEILSDDEKLQKFQEEAEKASKEKASAPSTSDQQDSLGEGSGSVSVELDHQGPGKEEGEDLTVKEVSFAKLNTKDKVLMKALSEDWDLCYQQDNLSVQHVRGAIMNILSTLTAAQIHNRKLFKLGPPGNCVMDNIHSHWESYLHSCGALANAPYSQFHPQEGWDAVYTWESLKTHEPMFAYSFGKKANKPSLVVVVTPTTTEIGDDYFLSKLHTYGLLDSGEVNMEELSWPTTWQLLQLSNGWGTLIFLTASTILHLVNHIPGHSRPPKALLHERKGVTLTLVSCLMVASIQHNTSV